MLIEHYTMKPILWKNDYNSYYKLQGTWRKDEGIFMTVFLE